MLVGKMIVKVVVSLVHLLAVGALSVLFFMITFPVPFKYPPVRKHIPVFTVWVLTFGSFSQAMFCVLVDPGHTVIIMTKVTIRKRTEGPGLSQMDSSKMGFPSFVTAKVFGT